MNIFNTTTEYGTVNVNAKENTMNRSEIVRNYVAANPNPDQDLCPTCYQYWGSSKGQVIWDNVSGVRRCTDSLPPHSYRADYFCATPRSCYSGAYVKYIPEIEMFEVANIILNVGGRGLGGYPQPWEYYYPKSNRLFAFKGDTSAYDVDGNEIKGGKYYSKNMVGLIHSLTYSGYHIKYTQLRNVMRAISGTEPDEYASLWSLEDMYKRSWLSRSVSKTTKTITEYKFDDPKFLTDNENIHTIIVHKILDDNYSVLRRFDEKYVYNKGKYVYTGEWNENLRIFVDKKGKTSVMMPEYGEWKLTTRQIDRYWYSDYSAKIVGTPLEDWRPLKYIKETIDWNQRRCLAKLVATLRHPIIEQMAKSGYPCLAKEIMSDNAIAANLKAFFYAKEAKKPIYELLGVNKHILKFVEETINQENNHRRTSGLALIRDLKRLYGKSEEDADIRHLSPETVELAGNGLKDLNYGEFNELLGVHRYYRRKEDWINIDDAKRHFIEKLFRLNAKTDQNIVRLYIDVQRLYDQIDDERRPDIDIHDFNDVHGLEIIHNGLIAIKTIQDAERKARWDAMERERQEKRKKIFEKLQKERIEKYETEDDEFCIRVPKLPEEITQEGCALHHCVGGYVDRHCEGSTNIIFLRRKGLENLPFYTIEVCNDRVIQIHGSHNRWLGNNPEAIPFVYKWINDRGFSYEKKMLLNLGAGYSSSTEQLDDSYLTKH